MSSTTTTEVPLQTVENTLVADNSVEATPQQTPPNIMCHAHPTIAAVDRCYTCRRLVCVACKEYQTAEYWVKGGTVYVPFTTCASCLARNSSWKGLEDSTRNKVFSNLSGCTIQ